MTAIPQPGETWEHRHLGPVKVVRRWNDVECVCEGARPGVGTRILRDEFLQGPKHQWTGGMTPSTPSDPPEGYCYCANCGLEQADTERDDTPCPYDHEAFEASQQDRALILEALRTARNVFDDMDATPWKRGCPVEYRHAQEAVRDALRSLKQNI